MRVLEPLALLALKRSLAARRRTPLALLALRRSLAAVGVAALCAGLLASCAPPAPRGLETLEEAARRGAERRARRLVALEAQAIVRVDGRATGRLPAVAVSARLASPDRVRIQCRWLLGLLADIAVRGDTLVAWMPSGRLGLHVDDLADTLGVRDPALFFGRALLAAWEPPREAWRAAVADSGGAVLAWTGGDEAWQMHVDREGRPRDVRVERDGRSLTARYDAWRGSGPRAWPAKLELEDGAGWVRLRLELEDLRTPKRPRAHWFALTLPDDARPLTLDDVKRVLSRSGGLVR